MTSPMAGSLHAMSEPDFESTWDDDERRAQERPDGTGLPRVDAVIGAVSELVDLPLEEQVTAFEAAHGELRATLDHADSPSRA